MIFCLKARAHLHYQHPLPIRQHSALRRSTYRHFLPHRRAATITALSLSALSQANVYTLLPLPAMGDSHFRGDTALLRRQNDVPGCHKHQKRKTGRADEIGRVDISGTGTWANSKRRTWLLLNTHERLAAFIMA